MILDKNPLVSVIMPAYNAAKFIGRAIESVLSQTYSNVELIIVDDASTDNTCEIVESYKDDRVKLFREKTNSGSAYMPRYKAYMHSSGEYVLLLDSDDYLLPDYVALLMTRLQACNADVCCGWMVMVDEDGHPLGDEICVPKNGFDFNQKMTGREAFFHTVPGWKIGMNGCLAKRAAWDYGFKRTYKSVRRGIHDDENVSRYILLGANQVVFARACYFYTINQSSVTHVFNERVFDYLRGVDDLRHLIGEDFGTDSPEYKAVEENFYMVFRSVRGDLLKALGTLSKKERRWYLNELKSWHKKIHWDALRNIMKETKWHLERNYWLSVGGKLLKNKQIMLLCKMARKTISVNFRRKKYQYHSWYVRRKKRENMIRSQIMAKYQGHEGGHDPLVVSIFDGTVRGGGLADRLRGIISTYAVCKQLHVPYRLFFTNPFDLSMFLEPNEYDWRIEPDKVNKDASQTEIVILDSTEDSPYQFAKQGEYLRKHLKIKDKQVHVFTNAAYSYTLDYAKLFGELFRPTPRLARALAREKENLGERYISVSARFLDLLGDSNEPCGYGHSLSEKDAQNLIERSLAEIEKIHQQSPEKVILVNSDSKRFLEAANKLPYTYIAPGEVTHIDGVQHDDSYERYEKTFLDFFLIADASEIILLRSGRMLRSGYPYAASLLYGHSFYEVDY